MHRDILNVRDRTAEEKRQAVREKMYQRDLQEARKRWPMERIMRNEEEIKEIKAREKKHRNMANIALSDIKTQNFLLCQNIVLGDALSNSRKEKI